MKVVSNDFKQAAIAPVKESSATITVYNDDQTTTVFSASDYLQSISIEATADLLGTYASQATFNLLGTTYETLLGKDIDILYSLVVNGNNENIDFGHFEISDVKTDFKRGTTTLKANSQMLQLQSTDYQPMSGFPMSVGDLAQAIADKFELNLDDMTGLPNVTQIIDEDLYANINGETYRNILAEIAGTTGTMAYIDKSSSTLVFRPYQSAVQQAMDYTYLKSYKEGLHYGPVNSIVLSRTPQEDNIVMTDDASVLANGLTEVKIANNEIMDDDRTAYITALYNALIGMEWTGFEIETVGLGWLECGDRVSITDENNNTIEGIITYIKLTIDGGIKEEIKAVPPIGTETNYALAGGITKTIYNTEIKVDKQNQQIQSIVESQESFENQVINNFTNVTQNINSVVTSVQASGGNNLIKNSAFFTSDDSGRFTEWSYNTPTAILPDDYQQVEYLEGSGATQWIDTGYNGNLNTQVEIVVMQTEDSTYHTVSCFGDMTDSSQAITINLPTNVTTIAQRFGDKYFAAPSNALSLRAKYTIITNKTGMTVNGTSVGSFGTTTNFTSSDTLKILNITGQSDDSYRDGSTRIYSCVISENGTDVLNLVPCYQISTGIKGFYDTVNDTFLTNQGTGADFTAGQAIGIPTVEPSGEAMVYGSLSGQIIHLEDVSIAQKIQVKADDESIPEDYKTYYSFSARVKKSSAGTASITIADGTADGTHTINLANGTAYLWEEVYVDAILPQTNELTITVQGSVSSDFQITDMMLCVGNYHNQWQQASGESNNTQVSITTEGVTVKNGNLASTWAKHTPQSFDIYKDRKITSSLNSDEVMAPSAKFTTEVNMKPIKIVQQSDGWAFVKSD